MTNAKLTCPGHEHMLSGFDRDRRGAPEKLCNKGSARLLFFFGIRLKILALLDSALEWFGRFVPAVRAALFLGGMRLLEAGLGIMMHAFFLLL